MCTQQFQGISLSIFGLLFPILEFLMQDTLQPKLTCYATTGSPRTLVNLADAKSVSTGSPRTSVNWADAKSVSFFPWIVVRSPQGLWWLRGRLGYPLAYPVQSHFCTSSGLTSLQKLAGPWPLVGSRSDQLIRFPWITNLRSHFVISRPPSPCNCYSLFCIPWWYGIILAPIVSYHGAQAGYDHLIFNLLYSI